MVLPGDNDLTVDESERLLELIYKAITEYGSCDDMPLSEFAADVAMSMEVTTDKADSLREAIETHLAAGA